MSENVVHYVPIVTTILAVIFSAEIFRRYREHPDRLHLWWWAFGIAVYGVGTFTEAATTLIGWNEPTFRAWYISGALLGGAPLAQGTVFLIGGAILSALRYSANPATRHRVIANVLIAAGAILPGIGGTATRMGYTEVLYVTELAGLLLTWAGYRMSVRPAALPATA